MVGFIAHLKCSNCSGSVTNDIKDTVTDAGKRTPNFCSNMTGQDDGSCDIVLFNLIIPIVKTEKVKQALKGVTRSKEGRLTVDLIKLYVTS